MQLNKTLRALGIPALCSLTVLDGTKTKLVPSLIPTKEFQKTASRYRVQHRDLTTLLEEIQVNQSLYKSNPLALAELVRRRLGIAS